MFPYIGLVIISYINTNSPTPMQHYTPKQSFFFSKFYSRLNVYWISSSVFAFIKPLLRSLTRIDWLYIHLWIRRLSTKFLLVNVDFSKLKLLEFIHFTNEGFFPTYFPMVLFFFFQRILSVYKILPLSTWSSAASPRVLILGYFLMLPVAVQFTQFFWLPSLQYRFDPIFLLRSLYDRVVAYIK